MSPLLLCEARVTAMRWLVRSPDWLETIDIRVGTYQGGTDNFVPYHQQELGLRATAPSTGWGTRRAP